MLQEGQTVKIDLVFSVVETGEVIGTLEIPAGHYTIKEERGITTYRDEKGVPTHLEPNGYQRGQLRWWGKEGKGTSYDDFKKD
jgi:hypothetical protein